MLFPSLKLGRQVRQVVALGSLLGFDDLEPLVYRKPLLLKGAIEAGESCAQLGVSSRALALPHFPHLPLAFEFDLFELVLLKSPPMLLVCLCLVAQKV